jgi:hypothetical protein
MTTVSDPDRFDRAVHLHAAEDGRACSVVPACPTAEPDGVASEVVGSPR